jgi:long-chain acyl-CoA synthetase
MFTGYLGVNDNPDLREGWLHTGDAGYHRPDGRLVVIDRIKDIAETSTGTRFSPQYIENKLKFSPFVAEAVVLGAGQSHLSAMICIRFQIVSKWAERNRIAFTTYSDLSSRPQVLELLRTEVEKVNATLPPAQQLREFVLLYKELDADDEELTRTRKVRRGVIAQKYGDIIEAIYRGDDAIPVDTTIAFQDGTKQRIRTTLAVMRLGRQAAMAAE